MTYGKRLDQALTNAGKSRKDLAVHLGCAPQTIGIVITGAGKIGRKLSTDNHARAVEFLKSNGEWLLTGECEMLPTTATASITAPSATLSASNHAPAHIQQAPVAISFNDAVRVIAQKLMDVDEATGRRAMGVLADLATDPQDFERLARATAAVIETGKRRVA